MENDSSDSCIKATQILSNIINIYEGDSENKRKELYSNLGLKDGLPVALCFGGSQGAQSINQSLIKIIIENKNINYQIIWAAGPAQYEKVKEELKKHDMDI